MSDDLVYSTAHGGDLRKKRPHKKKKSSLPSGITSDGTIRIRRETKGRKGKTATCIYGLPFASDILQPLAKKLKQSCGCGGSVKEGVIVIQGEVAEPAATFLRGEGYRVKTVGR